MEEIMLKKQLGFWVAGLMISSASFASPGQSLVCRDGQSFNYGQLSIQESADSVQVVLRGPSTIAFAKQLGVSLGDPKFAHLGPWLLLTFQRGDCSFEHIAGSLLGHCRDAAPASEGVTLRSSDTPAGAFTQPGAVLGKVATRSREVNLTLSAKGGTIGTKPVTFELNQVDAELKIETGTQLAGAKVSMNRRYCRAQ
jgi:hypothetical protein